MEKRSFLLVLALVTLLFLFLMKPFFGVIFWACVVALIFYPLHLRLLARLHHRPNTAALVSLLTCVVIGVLPTLFVLGSFVKEGAGLYQRLQSGELDPRALFDQLRQSFPAAEAMLARYDIDLNNLRELTADAAIAGSGYVAGHAMKLGQGTLRFFLSLGVMLYLAFFLLRDGPRIVTALVRALPLGDERERLLFAKFAEVTRATVKGNLVVAAIQGALGGFIFWALGISAPVLWGVVMAVFSLVPVVGAAAIWAPAAVYLLVTGNWISALILTGFGAGVIGLVDNIVRPILVGRDTKLPDYMVLLSTLGGFALFGISGFVIGPLIAALFVVLWDIFAQEFSAEGVVTLEDNEEAPVRPL